MKIIHIVDPFAAGLATFIKTLIESNKDDENIVIHGERKNVIPVEKLKKTFPADVEYIFWSNVKRDISIKNDFKAFIELYQILKNHKDANIVHLHSSKAGFIGRIVCSMLGIKNVVYTPNGVSFINDDIPFTKKIAYKYLEKIGYIFRGQVVATSISEWETLNSNGIKAELIPNGTKITKKKLCLEEKAPKSKFVVATCGRIAPQKAPNLFNRIAKQLESNEDIEFVWIGSGKEREKLQSKNIRVTGWLDKNDVFKEICNADLYISTARWEGLPFSVLEAMNLERPLLLSKCVGNNDLVEEGVNGYQFENEFDAGIKILQLKNNSKKLEQFGKNSKKICINKYRIEDTSRKYKFLYFKLAYGLSICHIKLDEDTRIQQKFSINTYAGSK
jgi:glycosyltransferase involved in cell wall biosynthesis